MAHVRQSRPDYGLHIRAQVLVTSALRRYSIGPHVLRTPVLLSEAFLAHDVHVCLESPSGALPTDTQLQETVFTFVNYGSMYYL